MSSQFVVNAIRGNNGRRLDPVSEDESAEMRRLRDEENLGTREIARRLERSPSAVKTHLSKGSPLTPQPARPSAAAASRQEPSEGQPSTALAQLRTQNPDLAPLVDEVQRLSGIVQSGQGSSTVAGELREAFSGLGVHAGLCMDENCTPCRMAAHELVMETRRRVAQEIEEAAESAGLSQEAEKIGEAVESYRANQRERPTSTGQHGHKPGSVESLLRGGAHVSA